MSLTLILAIVGGRIEVASEHGEGSTFRFFIAARACQTQKRTAESEVSGVRALSRKRANGKNSIVETAKPHVLIVEDNLINQTVLMRQLRHVGLTCEGESKSAAEYQA